MSDEEIDRVVEQCTEVEQNFEHELVNLKIEQDGAIDAEAIRKRDDLYESAIEVVLREGRGSCSLLQRALGIGYGRAARMIDYMAEDGIVGQHNGSSAREIQMTMEEWELIKHGTVAVDGESGMEKTTEDDYFSSTDEFVEVEDGDVPEGEFEEEQVEYEDAEDDQEYEYEDEEIGEDDEEYEYEEECAEDEDEDELDDEDVEYIYVEEEDDAEYEYEDEQVAEAEDEQQQSTISLAKVRRKATVVAGGSDDEEELWEEYDEDDSWADEVDEEFDQ